MSISFVPKTKLGKWSVGLIVACLLLLIIGNLVRVLQDRMGIGEWTFFSNPQRTFPMFGGEVAGIVGFFTGIISIWKQKERSILVFVAVAIGLFLLVLTLAEILSIIGILPPF